MRDDCGVGEVELVDGAVNRVDLHGGNDIETGLLEAKAEASGPRKQVDSDGSHGVMYLVRLLFSAILAVDIPHVDRILTVFHKLLQMRSEGIHVGHLALPDKSDSSAPRLKTFNVRSVAVDIRLSLRLPVVEPGFRCATL